jgi:tetraacyldisaccharide 4'-kinase
MREPAFWWRRSPAGALLAPLGALYGTVTAARMRRPGARAAVPVICVGNLTLGGSGKTPTAIAIAQLLKDQGHTPVMLTRGYGGRERGPLRVMPDALAPMVGDEPLLLARAATTIVAADRPAGAATAVEHGASVIVMDDGLQNPSLHKHLALAVIDGRRGIGNGRVFPAGPLRAPLVAQLKHIDAALIVGESSGATPVIAATLAHHRPVFHATLAADPAAVERWRGRKVLAFAGIGDPQKFFDTLAQSGIDTIVRRAYADHHRYTAQDAADLIALADRDNLQLLTTEKDLVRIAGDADIAALAQRVAALPVTLALQEPQAFANFVLARINR